jgi:ABC-type transporter Mla subunit MlaD
MVRAQTAAKTPEQLTKDVQDLQQNLTAATANLTKLATQVAKNTEAITTNSQGIERLTTFLKEELRKQQDILARIDELTQQQQDQLARQQAILDTIAQKDSTGRDMLRLSANMEQSEEFRDDVRKAVQQALDTHGDLTIHNRMENRQQIVVNQKEYGLGADEILTLKVPTGTVTAQLPGQPVTDWTVGAPNYSQKIEIVPEKIPTTTKVYRLQ